MNKIIPGIYQHYKGNLYRVIGLGRDSEKLEEFVVYQALYGDYGLWIRPAKMFTEHIEINGTLAPRFKLLQECMTHAPRIRE